MAKNIRTPIFFLEFRKKEIVQQKTRSPRAYQLKAFVKKAKNRGGSLAQRDKKEQEI